MNKQNIISFQDILSTYQSKIDNKNQIKMIRLNEEICEFIGAFIGDGYLGRYGKRKNIYTIGFAGDKKLDEDYFKNYLVPLIKRNFPFTNPHLYYRTDENTLMLRIYSKKLFEFMVQLGFKPGVKTYTVTIPLVILENKDFLNATIRGLFDTDGCIFFDKRKTYNKPYPRIILELFNYGLINQVSNHLSKDFKIYINGRKTRKSKIIEIYGHKQLEKFLKQIGFSNQRHLSKITPPWHSSYCARY
ncbi:hypothetical protein GOV03_01410 [Candidatus Woesearchaeota archaeon]|nr:hypothetical protein [Candidatus Woesearchaeota archaeon]